MPWYREGKEREWNAWNNRDGQREWGCDRVREVGWCRSNLKERATTAG